MNKRRLNYTLSLVVVLSFCWFVGFVVDALISTSGEKDFFGPTRGFGGVHQHFLCRLDYILIGEEAGSN